MIGPRAGSENGALTRHSPLACRAADLAGIDGDTRMTAAIDAGDVAHSERQQVRSSQPLNAGSRHLRSVHRDGSCRTRTDRPR